MLVRHLLGNLALSMPAADNTSIILIKKLAYLREIFAERLSLLCSFDRDRDY